MYKSIVFVRFSMSDRIEHWILAITFVLLALTGLSQMYSQWSLSEWIIHAFGGVETV